MYNTIWRQATIVSLLFSELMDLVLLELMNTSSLGTKCGSVKKQSYWGEYAEHILDYYFEIYDCMFYYIVLSKWHLFPLSGAVIFFPSEVGKEIVGAGRKTYIRIRIILADI